MRVESTRPRCAVACAASRVARARTVCV